MSPRSLRRAAERQSIKLARKEAKHNPTQGEAEAQRQPLEHETGRNPQPSVRYATGPRTPEGKAISCLNNSKHGLTGNFRLLESESQEVFDELRDALRSEHAPATPTESLLVDRLAEHVWLSQRGQRFQNQAALDRDHGWFALMLRYETMHDRAFHKCLAELRTLRRERQRSHPQPQASSEQFESQNGKNAANRGQNTFQPSENEGEAPTPDDPKTIAAGSNRKTASVLENSSLHLSSSSHERVITSHRTRS